MATHSLRVSFIENLGNLFEIDHGAPKVSLLRQGR